MLFHALLITSGIAWFSLGFQAHASEDAAKHGDLMEAAFRCSALAGIMGDTTPTGTPVEKNRLFTYAVGEAREMFAKDPNFMSHGTEKQAVFKMNPDFWTGAFWQIYNVETKELIERQLDEKQKSSGSTEDWRTDLIDAERSESKAEYDRENCKLLGR